MFYVSRGRAALDNSFETATRRLRDMFLRRLMLLFQRGTATSSLLAKSILIILTSFNFNYENSS